MADPLDFFILILRNLFLTLVTFGLYYPWARAARLRFIAEHTLLGSHHFRYTGHGKEILIGYLKVFGLLFAIGLLQALMSRLLLPDHEVIFFGWSLVLAGIYGLLILIATWGAWSYRLSRHQYRGIQFSLDRSQRDTYMRDATRDFVLTVLTLGLWAPVSMFHAQRNLLNPTRYGNLAFSYRGDLKVSYLLSLKNFILTVITFGLYTPWAIAARLNYDYNRIAVGEKAQLVARVRGSEILLTFFVPLLMTTLTMGLAYPWITVWARNRFLSQLAVAGEIDYAGVEQRKSSETSVGETLGNVLDMDVSFGV